MLFYTKILIGVLGSGGVGASMGGIILLTVKEEINPAVFSDNNKRTWRNYLVQVQKKEAAIAPPKQLTCVNGQSCNIYKRDDSYSESSTKPNLIKVQESSSLKELGYYILNIYGNNLKINSFVQLDFPNVDNANVSLQIIAQASSKTDKITLPTLPNKLLHTSEWVNPFKIKENDDSAFSVLENMLFRNQAYPKHVKKVGVEHQNYMVFKWQDVTDEDQLHINKRTAYYLPSDKKTSLQSGWQTKFNPEFQSDSSPIFFHPFATSNKIKQDLSYINNQIVAVDSYLFKTFAQQQEEIADLGKLKVRLDPFTKEQQQQKQQENDSSQSSFTKGFVESFVEIYEITNQANIAKSLPTDGKGVGFATAVNWLEIDQDDLMITKLSELQHGKYYKFVFSNETIIKQFANETLNDVTAILFDKDYQETTSADSSSTDAAEDSSAEETGENTEQKDHFEIFKFSDSLKDFYCLRSEVSNSCSYFEGEPVTDVEEEEEEQQDK